jgi:hypothetical protein
MITIILKPLLLLHAHQDANDKLTWEHPAENCLSHFSLDHFNLAGSIRANGAIETSVVLHTISLDDKRAALEKGITTLVYIHVLFVYIHVLFVYIHVLFVYIHVLFVYIHVLFV